MFEKHKNFFTNEECERNNFHNVKIQKKTFNLTENIEKKNMKLK